MSLGAEAALFQSKESIEVAIKEYISLKLPAVDEYTVQLRQVDNRLQFPLCSKALEAFTRSDVVKAGRNSIAVKCSGDKKWTLYSSVLIQVYKNVITLARSIRRGEVISKNMLQVERHDITSLRSGYFTDEYDLLNKQVTRSLGEGSVINQSNIKQRTLIKRGERLQIKAGNENLKISVIGVALMDGRLNQKIKVKNIASKKIIQATVVKSGLVVVTF